MRLHRLLLPALLLPLSAAAFEPALIDPQRAVCDSLYLHANGRWLAETPVPPGLSGLGMAERLAERSRLDRRALLEAAAHAPRDATDAELGTLWASLLDPELADASAQTALAPWLRRIERLAKPADVVDLLGAAHAAGLPLLFRLQVDIDSGQPDRRIAYALQGGLGLPERDYYLRHEAGAVALREAYATYVQTLLAAAGEPDPAAAALRVIELETRLARASQSLQQLADPAVSRRLARVRDTDRLFPNLEWRRYLRAQELGKIELVSLGHVAFFTEANALLAQLPIEHWRAYFRAQLLHQLAPYLGAPLREAHDALFGRVLGAEPRRREPWERALDAAEALLAPELGQRYREEHLPPAREQAAQAVFESLRAAWRRRIEVAAWLDAGAREAALARLAALRFEVARPAARVGTLPTLQAGDPVGNLLALLKAGREDELAGLGPILPDQPRAEPVTQPWLAYDAGRNRLGVGAALLQPPLFEPEAEAAQRFAGLGSLLAQELSHAFDASLGDVVQSALESRATALAAQYDAYPAVGELKVDGLRTARANLADLAALEIAFEAFASEGASAPPDAEGRSASQRFFLAWAQAGRRAVRDEVLRLHLLEAVHAPPRWRIDGPVSNHPAFAAAFGCATGTGLAREEAGQVSVWR